MKINLFKWQPQQVHGRRPSSSKAASDVSQTSQDDAGVGSVHAAASPPAGSGRGSKSPASSPPPSLTPTSPRSNSSDKRTLAPALSSVTIHTSQEQVGVLIIVISTAIILIIHGLVHHCWLSCSWSCFHSLPTELCCFICNFIFFCPHLPSALSTSCLFPNWLSWLQFPSRADLAHSHFPFNCHGHNVPIVSAEFLVLLLSLFLPLLHFFCHGCIYLLRHSNRVPEMGCTMR